ncbi:MAG: type II toxin-antitoxin system RelE/ParE family toxin [Dysgonamonadaceae bacterium]|nr:type II toxin-antitoxin system RelE/ParE family toxin [Dysgonamonadaceae bacterium]
MVNIYLVRWSQQSKSDLREIFNYVLKTEKSREKADYVVSGIKQKVNEIKLFPEKHTKEFLDIPESMRYALKWSYKILFTVDEKYVNIVRIFHTAQNPEKLCIK